MSTYSKALLILLQMEKDIDSIAYEAYQWIKYQTELDPQILEPRSSETQDHTAETIVYLSWNILGLVLFFAFLSI